MFEFIGLVFIVLVITLLYKFVTNKHKAIVDRKPEVGVAILQRKTVLDADSELKDQVLIGTKNIPRGAGFNR